MIRTTSIALALCACAGGATAAASACEVETRAAASTVVLEDCGVRHLYVPDGEEGLKPAENIWLGYVLQVYHQSEGCLYGEAQVVVDCANGHAFSFAPAGAALMTKADFEVAQAGIYGQRAASIREYPWGYDSMEAPEDARELTVIDLGSALAGPVALGSHGQSYDLTCACKLFNPASKGAGE